MQKQIRIVCLFEIIRSAIGTKGNYLLQYVAIVWFYQMLTAKQVESRLSMLFHSFLGERTFLNCINKYQQHPFFTLSSSALTPAASFPKTNDDHFIVLDQRFRSLGCLGITSYSLARVIFLVKNLLLKISSVSFRCCFILRDYGAALFQGCLLGILSSPFKTSFKVPNMIFTPGFSRRRCCDQEF